MKYVQLRYDEEDRKTAGDGAWWNMFLCQATSDLNGNELLTHMTDGLLGCNNVFLLCVW